jgi:hypothetical protein
MWVVRVSVVAVSILCFSSLSLTLNEADAAEGPAPISNTNGAAAAPDPSQFRIILSPGVKNIGPNGKPMFTIDQNPADWATIGSSAVMRPTTVTPSSLPVFAPFTCLGNVVQLCGASITVKGGTVVGGTVDVTMPAPFVPDHFTAQCINTGTGLPIYQVSDQSEVTCQTVSSTPDTGGSENDQSGKSPTQ